MHALAVVCCALFATAVHAQVDISDEWANRDQEDRRPDVTTSHFKREPDGSKFHPRRCELTPPVVASATR